MDENKLSFDQVVKIFNKLNFNKIHSLAPVLIFSEKFWRENKEIFHFTDEEIDRAANDNGILGNRYGFKCVLSLRMPDITIETNELLAKCNLTETEMNIFETDQKLSKSIENQASDLMDIMTKKLDEELTK